MHHVHVQYKFPAYNMHTYVSVTIVILCVCLHVHWPSCYTSHWYVKSLVPLGFLCHFQCLYCVNLIENAYSKVLARSADHHYLLCFLMNSRWTRDSDGFFSRRLTHRTSDSSYNLTGSSLVKVDCHYQQSFLAFFLCSELQNCWSGMCMVMLHIMQLQLRILVFTLDGWHNTITLHC